MKDNECKHIVNELHPTQQITKSAMSLTNKNRKMLKWIFYFINEQIRIKYFSYYIVTKVSITYKASLLNHCIFFILYS